MSWLRCILLFFFLGVASLQTGCLVTAVGLAAAGVATAKETIEDVTERSYPQPYWCVYRAAHAALYEMEFGVDGIEQGKEGDIFHAKTAEYPVTVELHRVTENVTRVRVEAGKNMFQQDQATAKALADAIHDIIERNLQSGLVINKAS